MTDIQTLNPPPEETPIPSSIADTLTEPPDSTGRKLPEWTTILRVLIIGIVIISSYFRLMSIGEKPKVVSVIDMSMTALKDGDAEKAYALMSHRTRPHNTSLADLEIMLKKNRVWLQAYQKVSITNIKVRKSFANDPSLPQGTIADVSGEMTFDGGRVEPFEATLQKDEGEWRIYGIHIGPPLDEGSQ